MADDAAFIWNQPTPQRAQRTQGTVPDAPPATTEGRITLREAERRFGIRVSTLQAWSRRRTIDSVKVDEQWYVTPESIAHHLSRTAPRTQAPPRGRSTGPTDDGAAMLVPRDAWDRLMDQLGNLHEAGLHLAEARERAAKAETEASFLRERLAEMRTERDDLRARTDPPQPAPASPRTSPWDDLRRRYGWLWGRRG